jgi:drug/metabolite transporter (DMT)-like permease
MSVPAAFVVLILIWSTTPLAIKWSGEGVSYLFGALGRMSLAVTLCVLVVVLLRIDLPWHRTARRAYVAGAIALYGAMLCIYWGVQFVPSGLVSVLYGISPLLIALMARWLLGERGLTPAKIAGMVLGLIGLVVIFGGGIALGPHAIEGIAALLFGVVINALSIVLVKRDGGSLHPMAVTTGSLLYTMPLYLITWLVFDGHWPTAIPAAALGSIVYLGLIASVFGFTLFYFVLKRISASAAALLTLITPVTALLVGMAVANETVPLSIWTGTALVLGGLGLHQYGHHVPLLRPVAAGGD